MIALCQPPMREDILDLSDADTFQAGFLDRVQKRPPAGRQGKVTPVARPDKMSRFAHEGSCDHPAHAQFALQHVPGNLTELPELFRRKKVFMAGNLEYAVPAGIDDRCIIQQFLFAQFVKNRRAGGRLVANHLVADGFFKCFNKGIRKTVRESRESLFNPHPGNFPVAGSRILAFADFDRPSPGSFHRPVPAVSGSRNSPQAQRSHRRQFRVTRGDYMSQGIGSGVPVLGGVRQRACTYGIQYGQKYAAHFSSSFSIQGSSVKSGSASGI